MTAREQAAERLPSGARPTLVTAFDPNVGEGDSVEIQDDYVLIVDGSCSFTVVGVEDGGATHILRVTGRNGTPQPEAAPESAPVCARCVSLQEALQEAQQFVLDAIFAVGHGRSYATTMAALGRADDVLAAACKPEQVSCTEAARSAFERWCHGPAAYVVDYGAPHAEAFLAGFSVAREALAASEKEIPGGEQGSPVAEEDQL